MHPSVDQGIMMGGGGALKNDPGVFLGGHLFDPGITHRGPSHEPGIIPMGSWGGPGRDPMVMRAEFQGCHRVAGVEE